MFIWSIIERMSGIDIACWTILMIFLKTSAQYIETRRSENKNQSAGAEAWIVALIFK